MLYNPSHNNSNNGHFGSPKLFATLSCFGQNFKVKTTYLPLLTNIYKTFNSIDCAQ